VVNNTNVGGRRSRLRGEQNSGCLPPRTGGGWAATTSFKERVQPSGRYPGVPRRQSERLSAGARFLQPARPLFAEMFTPCAHCSCASSGSIPAPAVTTVLVDQVPFVERSSRARPASITIDKHPLILLVSGCEAVDKHNGHLGASSRRACAPTA